MKINILYKFQNGPWGGGNQFLTALRKEFIKKNIYEEDPDEADIILFNSFPFRAEYLLNRILELKENFAEKIILYRLDGPVSFVRGRDKDIDIIIKLFNNLFADGIIFQSHWSRGQNRKSFGIYSNYEKVIHNATDKENFNKEISKKFNPNNKIKLIATSWSANWKKGFRIYKYLDETLDYSKYEMTFVGNSPIEFKNIKWIKPVPSNKMAEILKQHDIYITASQSDPCSNSLIESLCCGLPAVALNDGGNPELVKEGGAEFIGKEDIIEKIEKVVNNYPVYQKRIPEFSIERVGEDYYRFAENIFNDVKTGIYKPKQITFFTRINFYKMKFMIFKWKISNKVKSIWN